jgi:hypothetical protein
LIAFLDFPFFVLDFVRLLVAARPVVPLTPVALPDLANFLLSFFFPPRPRPLSTKKKITYNISNVIDALEGCLYLI